MLAVHLTFDGRRSWFQLLVVAVLCCGLAVAGGPLQTLNGVPVRWDPTDPVNFILDNGPLKTDGITVVISRDQAADFVRGVLQEWEDVPSSLVRVQDRGFLPEDVTLANHSDFLFQVRPEGNPIIFDVTGEIVDEVLGSGSSDNVLGFAGSFELTGDDLFDYGVVVLNGLQADLDPDSGFGKALLHEFGHLLGLDHTQVGLEFFLNSDNETVRRTVPLMFPIATPGPAQLYADDLTWVSYLYPAEDFPLETGVIEGSVARRIGAPFQGANVLAIPVDRDPENKPVLRMEDRVAVVSGFLEVPGDSSFQLPLTPGEYVVAIEPIFFVFVGGSGVGPYDARFEGFPRDFWNGSESGDPDLDDPDEMTVLTVAAGQATHGIDLVSNETVNQLDTLGDDDQELFLFPEGFVFPFFGQVHHAINVNSNGNLTFVDGDSSFSTTEEQFTSGLPRLAPLFTDLDPSSGGQVTSEYDGDSLTFLWNGIPEFGALPEEGNTFSVRLFRNGNVSFQYQDIGGAGAGLVGVSPGGLVASPGPTDLSSGQPFRFADDAIFEILGSGGFDLQEVLFQLETQLLFPLNLGDASTFTGFAVTNDSQEVVALDAQALQASGQLQMYPQNPSREDLAGRHQTARLGSDFFGVMTQDGWVRIGTNGTALASFYQFGSATRGAVTQLDGSVAFDSQSTVLYFTRLYDGAGSFPTLTMPRAAETLLAISNPNAGPITITLQLFAPAGNTLGAPVERMLNPQGCLLEGLDSLFGAGPISDGFVRADIDGPGAVGFELVRLEDTLLGFNASFGNQRSVLFSAQLAHGGEVLPVFTSIKVVNTSSEVRNLTFTALGESGDLLSGSVSRALQPHQSLQADAGQFFGLGPPDGPASVGSLRVESDGPGVIGDVVFGDPNTLRNAAALPLQTRLFQRAIFSQVTNLRAGRNQLRTFTGLAFHNPQDEAADITIRVFTAGGVEVGTTQIQLGMGERTSQLVADLVPASAGQAGGYIVVESTLPIVAQQLFGNFSLDFLSAVPPTVRD